MNADVHGGTTQQSFVNKDCLHEFEDVNNLPEDEHDDILSYMANV